MIYTAEELNSFATEGYKLSFNIKVEGVSNWGAVQVYGKTLAELGSIDGSATVTMDLATVLASYNNTNKETGALTLADSSAMTCNDCIYYLNANINGTATITITNFQFVKVV